MSMRIQSFLRTIGGKDKLRCLDSAALSFFSSEFNSSYSLLRCELRKFDSLADTTVVCQVPLVEAKRSILSRLHHVIPTVPLYLRLQ